MKLAPLFVLVSIGCVAPLAVAQVSSTNIITGAISVPGERDVFTFSLTNRARYYFDALTNVNTLNWSLEGPGGSIVNGRSFTASDAGNASILSLSAGFHRLTVDADTANTNSYAFRLVDLAAATLLTPDTVVSNTLTPGNETDLYQFPANAGDRFLFDRLFLTSGQNIWWRLIDPFGLELFSSGFNDIAPLTLRAAGNYTLLIEGYVANSAVTTYSFTADFQSNVPPALFVGAPLTIGQAVAGSLTNHTTNAYTFTLNSETRVVFDTLTNSTSVQWFLEGPPGLIINNRGVNGSDGINFSGSPVLELPPGDYQLRVRRNAAGISPYRFRLLDLSAAAVVTPGTPILGSLTPSTETDAYRFTASAGSRFFFDLHSTNGPPSTRWRLLDPLNGVLEETSIATDRGPRTLTLSGTYTLLIEGYFGDDPGAAAFRFDIVPVSDGAQTLTLGALTSGSISVPGQMQQHYFTLPSAAQLYFDSRTNHSTLRWSLAGPSGVVVNNRNFTASDGLNALGALNLAGGDYMLTVTGLGDDTGGYAFRLFDLANAATLTPGTPITSTLSPANETDAYRFTAAANTAVYFDSIASSGLPNGFWRCLDPFGGVVAGTATYLTSPDPGVTTLTAGGVYTVLIEGYHSDPGSGTYTINVVPVTHGTQSLTLGTIVSGAISSPGQEQAYTFQLPGAARLYFDSLTNNGSLHWSLEGSAGVVVNNRTFTASDGFSALGVLNLASGNYQLTVAGANDATGQFLFRLFDLAGAAPMTLGLPVSGTLDPGNETDAYRFSAAAGQKVYFDLLTSSSLLNAYWRCIGPSGELILSTFLGDAGPEILPSSGIYTLLIEGYHADTDGGAYQLTIVPVSDGAQSLALGSIQSGAIAVPGQSQSYSFTLATPANLYLDAQTNADNLFVSLAGPSGAVFNNRPLTFIDYPFSDPWMALTPGNYTLTINGSLDNIGPYRFRLFDIAGATAITPGSIVNGTLDPANETEAYRFHASAGDRYSFQWISHTGIPNSYQRLYDPLGNLVFLSFSSFGSEPITNQLAATGTYTLLVEGSLSDTAPGSYQFRVNFLDNVSTPFTGTPLILGNTVSGNLPTAETTNTFTFTVAAPTRLFFDNLENGGPRWSLEGPQGILVNNRFFQNSDGAEIFNSWVEAAAGNYRLTVSGDAGAYSFRVLDAANATPFAAGALVSGTVTPGSGTTLYRFTANAGERIYYEGRSVTGFSTAPYVKISGPFGNQLLFGSADTDAEFSAPHTGSYIISLEGRYFDTSSSGSFSFLLQPIIDATNTFLVGQTVSSAITHPGQSQLHRFSLAAPARLFFDTFTGVGVLDWTLTGPAGILVSQRQFWSSDSVDGNSLLNLAAGDYVIRVGATETNTPSYAFRLVDSSSAIPLTLGATVSGTLAPGNSTVLRHFNASAGDRVYFDGRPITNLTSTPYLRLYAPLGNVLLLTPVTSDVDVFTLPQSGTYLLAIEGRYIDTSTNGTYTFVFHPVTDGTNNFAIGDTVSAAIATPGQRQFHSFTLATPVRLFFDTLTNSSLPWTLTGPGGVMVNSRALFSSDSIDGVSLLDLPAGNYTIMIEASGATTGSYAFRLLNATSATAFTPGTLVTNSLTPGNSTRLYRFTANAGAPFYFDGRPVSGFTSPPYVHIYTPLGVSLFAAFQASTDHDTFSVPQTGDYILAVEGRYVDTSTNGNFSFVVVPNPSQPSTPLFETNVAPDLIVTGLAITPPTGLQSGQGVTVSWNTINNGTAPAPSSFTERVTVRNTGTSQTIVNRTLLYDDAALGTINGGQSRARQLALTLPEGPASVGNLEVTVTTDTLNNIFEQNSGGTGEANNAASITTTTTLATYPDLQVASLGVTPVSAWLTGSVVTVSWVITNTGNRATIGSWNESLLVRNTNTSQIIVNTTTNYDSSAPGNGDIAPNTARARTLSFTMPHNDSAFGAFEIVITTDSENVLFEYNGANTAENNNSRSLISASAPDLVINGLLVTADPGLEAGAELTIQWNTANIGNVPVSEIFYDRVLVRNTNTTEVLLNTYLPYNPSQAGNGAIAAGASRARNYTLDLPEGARSVGRLEITVTADTFDYLVEHNAGGTAEANNVSQTQVTIAASLYPDVVVTNIIAPAIGQPGQSVPFVWTIRNIGPVVATGPWSDQLFLSSDAAIGGDQFLASAFFSGTLNPGQSLTRTQQVTLPAFGTGNRFFVAEVDAGNSLFEENETNNAAIASAALQISAALTLTLSPSTVLESAGPQAVLATVTRNSDTASALTVTLGNNRPGKIIAPTSVTIPFAAVATNFFIQVLDDTIAESDVTATLTATAAAHVTATNTLTIVENDSPTLTLRLSAPSVGENAAVGAVTGTLTRNAQTNVALTVTLSSDRPGSLTVPASVVIPAGQTNASFNLDPVNDDLVTGNRAALIFASAAGFSSVSAPISILDDDTVTLTFQLSESAVNENTINPAAVGLITRTPVSSGALRVQLSQNSGGLLQIPAEVTIPANQPAVSFNLNVVDNNLAFGSRLVTIVAEGEAANGVPIPGATVMASINIRENDGPTLFVTTAVPVIEEGSNTVVTITRNTPPTNALAIALSVTPAGQATLPGAVVIALGATSTNVIIQGISDGNTDGAQEVTINASASGFNAGAAPLTVTDIDIPDLAIAEISAPTNALTDSSITVVWTVTNSGLAMATAPWVDEVYIARDSQGANAILLFAVTNNSAVPRGDAYSYARSFVLPSDPGDHWILVRTDAGRAIAEGSEHNNTALSRPIAIQPSYRATVSTTVDAAVAGTVIPLTGQTFYSSNGAPAPFRTATVRINVNQTRRTFSVFSDASGNFSGVFQPIPGEAGLYTVGADHPRVLEDAAQDQFILLGLGALPWQLNERLTPNVPSTGQIELRNLSPLPLTGLLVSTEGLPFDFTASATVSNGLAGGAVNVIAYTIATTLTTAAQGRFHFVVTSAEGATLRIPVDFTVRPPTAQLAAEPPLIEHGMLRGTQTLLQFDVVNQGGVASGDLSVALPVVPWLSLISTSPIPSLAPGARSTVILALSPPNDLPLTRYDGTIVFIGTEGGLSVPFQFRAISEARGDLVLNATDEHTYYASGAPKLTNAEITLRDVITSAVVTNGTTDATGQLRFNNLTEGSYVLEATAPRHSRLRTGVRVAPGVTTEQEIFLSRQEVTYEWRVVPAEITDHYRVVLEPQFETEVPQPNLVVENPDITSLVVPGRVSQFALRLRNTGLVALERVRVPVPNHPEFIITPLTTEIDVLPAQTSISVPVTIRLREAAPGIARPKSHGGCHGDDCVIALPIHTGFRCGRTFVPITRTVSLHAVCVPETGCDFRSFLDTSNPNSFNEAVRANRAEMDCLLGNMDECQKARIRGYLRSGDLGSVFFPPGALPPPLDGTNFGLSAFCACGPQSVTNTLFSFGTNLLNALGFPGSGSPAPPIFNFLSASIPGPCNAPALSGGPAKSRSASKAAGPGVCARVRLELSQDITLTRAAFQATLVLENGGDSEITGIQLTLDFRNASQQSANNLFGIRGPTLRGITGIDGSGVLPAQTDGSVEFLFVPTLDAAPYSPRSYYIGGTLRFTLDGQPLVIPLLPGEITVLPEARLALEYFQQRDVYSDDPFTPELEPAEPFALGLRVHNRGAGLARNFQIASAAPRIIENDKGLLIDFQLLGAHVDNAPLNPSFNLNLGNINPNQTKTVVWDMTSTLQGKFIDLRASFEHLDDFGVTNISLIESVNVHEMIHVVRADRLLDDALPDFLVNDVPDPNNLPDIVYLSQGSNAPVSLGSNPVVNGSVTTNNLQVQLTVTMPAGWAYLRMTNPGPDFRLTSVQRSDGKQIRIGDNVWTTDRTFPSSIPGALREKTLHLFDFDSTGIYTLNFAPIANDTNAPASAVAALPASSSANFAVQWSGNDAVGGSGLAFFDVYVSVNGGPFTNWLAHTTLQSALFAGVTGHTYAFYSRATDLEGNEEIAPASADAQTTASGVNSTPTLTGLANATINEGATFTVLATALDTDVPRQTLTFSLITAPAGAAIDSASGFISWTTGEAQGGTSNLFTVVVADGGLPSLTVTQSFVVVVTEVNTAPFFVNALTDVTVDEETLLAYTVGASDGDQPLNQLTWQLAPGAPAGLTLNPSNGLLSWTPGETFGPGEYPLTVTVRDNGSPLLSATRTVRVLVREVNRAPALAAIPSQSTLVETTLTVTNTASDSDLPTQQFFYSLAPGAPRGARINRTTGVLTWTPAIDYAESTNTITVRVTDSGVPSLTTEQSFVVIVGDLLDVSFGASIILAGQTGSVPIIVFSTTPLTNAEFTVAVSLNRFTSFAVDPPTPPLGSLTLQPLGNDQYRVRLGTLAGQSLPLGQSIVHLRVTALPGMPSSFVPFDASNVSGLQTDGQLVPRALGHAGRVVYLGVEPLLEMQRAGGPLTVTLFAQPGPTYALEGTASLTPLVQWTPLWSGSSSNLVQVFQLTPTNQFQFIRARRP